MEHEIRKWMMTDAADLALALDNPNIQNNLRDGLPYPYTENDAECRFKYSLCVCHHHGRQGRRQGLKNWKGRFVATPLKTAEYSI